MHRQLLILFLLFNSISSAQYRISDKDDVIKHHQISVNGSSSTWGLIFKLDGKLKWDTDSLSYDGRSKPALQLCYDYFFNPKISLGVMGSSQSLGMKVDYLAFKNPNDVTKRFNNFDISIKRRYLGLRFNYHFVNNSKTDLYIGARLGSVFWKVSPSITETDLDNKLSASFPGTFLPALGVGYKYKIKDRVGIGFELSLGTPQLYSYGVDFRF